MNSRYFDIFTASFHQYKVTRQFPSLQGHSRALRRIFRQSLSDLLGTLSFMAFTTSAFNSFHSSCFSLAVMQVLFDTFLSFVSCFKNAPNWSRLCKSEKKSVLVFLASTLPPTQDSASCPTGGSFR